MKKLLLSIGVLLLLSLSALAGQVSAQTILKYPIPELGYCRDAKECYLYCEITQNKPGCWSYGKFKLGPDVLGVTSEEENRTMEEKARQMGISFPIAALGNCASASECRNYCEQPTNREACMSFAKDKGLHKEEADTMDSAKRDELLQKARTELGCTSMESCKNICDNDRSRCEAFARRHGVYQEPQENQQQTELMEKAREELGCTSMASCKSICDANPERCREFASKHGFDRPKGEQQDQPTNVQRMMSPYPMSPRESGASGTYVAPSGCRTEGECEDFCKDNPSRCPGFIENQRRDEAREEEREQENEQEDEREDEQEDEREDEREDMMPPPVNTPPPTAPQ